MPTADGGCSASDGGGGYCARPGRLTPAGRRCPDHLGPQPHPDPALTLDGLRAAAGLPTDVRPGTEHRKTHTWHQGVTGWSESAAQPDPGPRVPPDAQRAVQRAQAAAERARQSRLLEGGGDLAEQPADRYRVE